MSQKHSTTFPEYNIEKINLLYTILWLHALLLCKAIKELSGGSVNHKMSLWTSQPYSKVHKSATSVRSDHLVKTHNDNCHNIQRLLKLRPNQFRNQLPKTRHIFS